MCNCQFSYVVCVCVCVAAEQDGGGANAYKESTLGLHETKFLHLLLPPPPPPAAPHGGEGSVLGAELISPQSGPAYHLERLWPVGPPRCQLYGGSYAGV